MAKKRCAIIGAGASGIPAARWALEYDYETVIFEATNEIGGLWNFKPDETEFSTVAKSTVINTSKEMTAYSDFPPPADSANFFHNRVLKQYFIDYSDHFGVTPCIRFQHRVLNVERAGDYEQSGRWIVLFQDEEGNEKRETFDCVLCCTGHHARPHMAHFPGQERFKGRIIHSHSGDAQPDVLQDHKGFEDKIVVVVGIGNSALDVACELARLSKQVYISTRRGAWIIRKTIDGGLPADHANSRFTAWIRANFPKFFTWIGHRTCNRVFDHEAYGLRPKHTIMQQHPSLSDELHGTKRTRAVSAGRVIVKGNIREFTEHGILFEDGFELPQVDDVVMCTGYSFDFPMLDGGKLVPVVDNHCKLYKRMFPLNSADKATIAVLGLVQPLGSIMPISEMQARVFFGVQAGIARLPSPAEQKAEIERVIDTMWKRYVKSPRHTIQVDFSSYMDELAELIGCKPRLLDFLLNDPKLFTRLLFGPAVAYSYRLHGPNALPEAREMILGVEERRIRATHHRDTGMAQYASSSLAFYLFAAGLLVFLYKLLH
ncbi:Dimethylaniline monooxygenase [N-oxide-forming] [Aphelenchoides fujianensis]|nr:Dimethylaniline monooxygenase [N-oxide-forming] [Aphelenchoides fujianensis]